MLDELSVPSVARWQGGAFTRKQAREAGATEGRVRWLLRKELWVPIAGVALRAATHEPDRFTFLHAAHLTWPDGVVVLGAAARAYGLPVPDDNRVDVVVATGRAPQRRLVPHRFRLDPDDVTETRGVRLTTHRRTILDCLGRLPERQALDLLAWVSSRRLLSAEDLVRWVVEHPKRWGNEARTRAAARLATGAVNPAEDLLHDILRGARITGWVAGASLVEHLGIWAQADVYFPEVRLVIEVDGRAAHGADRFQSDRTRQNVLVSAGCTVLRYTWSDLLTRPEYVAAQICSTLARLRATTATSARQTS